MEANTLISGAKRQGLNFPELPCERRDDPQQKVRRRSGVVPERALEANTKKILRAAHWWNFPELPCERRVDPAEPLSANPLR